MLRHESEDGIVSGPPGRETTGKLNTQLLRVVEDGDMSAEDANGSLHMSSEDFINRIADRVFEKMMNQPGGTGGGAGSPPQSPPPPPPEPPEKRFLGMDAGNWTRFLLGLAVMATIGAVGWYLTVRDRLRDAATRGEVHEAAASAVHHHEENGIHPKVEKRLKVVEIEQRTIRESQIRQEGIDERQADALDDIKEDLKALKRRRR
jgi:hypothetical protein